MNGLPSGPTEGELVGRGECVPYARYGETGVGVLGHIEAMTAAVASGLDTRVLQATMAAGAARNAIDCALWDLTCKRIDRGADGVTRHSGHGRVEDVVTCVTLSLDTPDAMAARAHFSRHLPLLKLKLGGSLLDAARLRAVRAAVPSARLVVDANEAWREDDLTPLMAVCREVGVELIEQPLPAGHDAALTRIERIVPVCADESVHATSDIAGLVGRYDAINVKLDKAGGLTEAMMMDHAARISGLKVMVGCMVATSLAMAPAMMLAQSADWVDLDGPLLLARDRQPGLVYRDGRVSPPEPELWG